MDAHANVRGCVAKTCGSLQESPLKVLLLYAYFWFIVRSCTDLYAYRSIYLRTEDLVVHFPMWYAAILLLASLGVSALTGRPAVRYVRLACMFSPVFLITPVIDVLTAGFKGRCMSYLVIEPNLLKQFIAVCFLGQSDYVTPGQLVAYHLLALSAATIVYLDSRRLWASLCGYLITGLSVFAIGLIPITLDDLCVLAFRAARSHLGLSQPAQWLDATGSYFGSLGGPYATLLLMVVMLLTFLLWRRCEPAGAESVRSKQSALAASSIVILAALGMGVGLIVFGERNRVFSAPDNLAAAMACLVVVWADVWCAQTLGTIRLRTGDPASAHGQNSLVETQEQNAVWIAGALAVASQICAAMLGAHVLLFSTLLLGGSILLLRSRPGMRDSWIPRWPLFFACAGVIALQTGFAFVGAGRQEFVPLRYVGGASISMFLIGMCEMLSPSGRALSVEGRGAAAPPSGRFEEAVSLACMAGGIVLLTFTFGYRVESFLHLGVLMFAVAVLLVAGRLSRLCSDCVMLPAYAGWFGWLLLNHGGLHGN